MKWYPFYGKFATASDFNKDGILINVYLGNFPKKNFLKTQNLHNLRILTKSVAFHRKCDAVW